MRVAFNFEYLGYKVRVEDDFGSLSEGVAALAAEADALTASPPGNTGLSGGVPAEAPAKRTRRTKAEMEAARAAPTQPPNLPQGAVFVEKEVTANAQMPTSAVVGGMPPVPEFILGAMNPAMNPATIPTIPLQVPGITPRINFKEEVDQGYARDMRRDPASLSAAWTQHVFPLYQNGNYEGAYHAMTQAQLGRQ